MFWNHNSAYYPWVQKRISRCCSVLDVGCGDGSLVFFLNDGTRKIVGIDADMDCIKKASLKKNGDNPDFLCCRFEDYIPNKAFDAIVFVASIHHMDMTRALQKAKSLLSPHGKLLIVGLAKPSTMIDWMLEGARIIPSKISSFLHHMQASEEVNIPISYDFMELKDIRSITRKELPNAKIRRALHYRYLLEWTAE